MFLDDSFEKEIFILHLGLDEGGYIAHDLVGVALALKVFLLLSDQVLHLTHPIFVSIYAFSELLFLPFFSTGSALGRV